MHTPDDFSRRIKALRMRLGLTQEELARRLDVCFTTVNRWEVGAIRPSKLAWRVFEEFERRNAPKKRKKR